MLNIINNLKPFFEDCYRRINVREYSRIMKISPPTSSKLLSNYAEKGLLIVEKDRNYIYYHTNNNSKDFIDLSRIYWRNKLIDVLNHLNEKLTAPTIILFGSLSKAENKLDSDIDLCVIAHKKEINLSQFEKKLKRNIQLFIFDSIKDIKNKDLLNNLINGYTLKGKIRI